MQQQGYLNEILECQLLWTNQMRSRKQKLVEIVIDDKTTPAAKVFGVCRMLLKFTIEELEKPKTWTSPSETDPYGAPTLSENLEKIASRNLQELELISSALQSSMSPINDYDNLHDQLSHIIKSDKTDEEKVVLMEKTLL
jgi:hypothetical protein